MKLILDTSIFVNPDSRCFFGKTPDKALSNFLDSVMDKKNIQCYMPPSVYRELMKFIEIKPAVRKLALIKKKPPSSYQTPVPALFLYEFIEEMRSRINKGLRISEKYTRKGLQKQEKAVEEIIKNLRVEYRTALREGVIDSREDFDLLLLAKEINGSLATSDNGLITWAHKLGISCITTEELKEVIS